ncbi:MAG: HD-GYP domain-containing protein [Lachnospiraceae bacterium]|nr:HD-GYP domain-containing protein [Lachnospiraceae bacterium]
MKRMNIMNLVPGMVTAEDVFSYNNTLIIPKGACLTDESITRLELYSIISIRIEDEVVPVEAPAVPDFNNPDSENWPYSQVVQSSEEFKAFKAEFNENMSTLKSCLNDVVEKNAPLRVDEMLHGTLDILSNCKTSGNVFSMLQNMRQYDDLTYAHSLNVALICNVFAGWLDFTPEDRELATICGLFHDIGKLTIPEDIVKKPSKLTDEEYNIIKTHPLEGYRILKNQDIDQHIKNSALMHHERCDGGGYPLGIKAEKIDRFAKIVSIADVYDAMTAARVYRGPLCPFTVIEIFEKEGLQKYDTHFILTFLENIVLTYMNNHVRLSNGQIGKIVFVNKTRLSRPMIATEDKFIDLSKEQDLHIEAIL